MLDGKGSSIDMPSKQGTDNLSTLGGRTSPNRSQHGSSTRENTKYRTKVDKLPSKVQVQGYG
jgi:hypothetical protein